MSAITPPEAKKLVAKVPDSLKSYFINISRLVNVMESPYKVLESRVDQVNTFNLSKQMFSLDKEARPNMVEMLDVSYFCVKDACAAAESINFLFLSNLCRISRLILNWWPRMQRRVGCSPCVDF